MDRTFDTLTADYDGETSTLRISGPFDPRAWADVAAEVDRAFRRVALRLTVDLTHAEGVPAHAVGDLVHLCNCCYPGTQVVVGPRARRTTVTRAA